VQQTKYNAERMQRRAASAFCRTKSAVFSMALPKSIAFFEKLWYNTDKFFENAATAGERRAALGQVALERRTEVS
jgi:hypothetical protein